MLSPRRTAQLVLSAACLTLVASITVLVAGSNDHHTIAGANQTALSTSHAAPLASGQLSANLSKQISQP